MDEHQIMFRSSRKSDNYTGCVSSLGDEIVDKIMESRTSSKREYWSRVFAVAEIFKNNAADFFERPQWEEICELFSKKSFMFCLKSNRKLFESSFDSLIKTSNALCDAFDKKLYSSNIHTLCINYLSSYYSIANLLQEREVLSDISTYGPQFIHMLKTGYIIKADNKKISFNDNLFFRFFSPVFIENLNVFYSFIENDVWYQNILFGSENENNINTIYRDVIIEKFKHLFFIEVPQFNERYVSTYYNIITPRLMNRDYLSSIEPIRPVRWLDKIMAYVENLKNSVNRKKNNGKIKIAVIGYVNLELDGKNCFSSELGMFYETLSKIRTEDFDGKYDFKISIFTNSNDKYFTELVKNSNNYFIEKNGICIEIIFVDYSEFFVPKGTDESDETDNLCAVIKEHDIVLLEDVPNIYTHEYKLMKKSGRVFPDNDMDSDYESEYKRMDFKSEDFLTLNFKYAPIHFLTSKLNLISMNEDVYEDTLKYRLNLPLINYLRDYIDDLRDKGLERNVYIFTSKKSGVEFSKYIQDNFTREERYNAKNFYLLTLSSSEDQKLPLCLDGKKSFIVFSLWNMLKNIDYSFVENEAFYNDILHCSKENVCALAMKIYVKMKWDFPSDIV